MFPTDYFPGNHTPETSGGAAPVEPAQPTSPTPKLDGLSGEVQEVLVQLLDSPGSESSSSTSSASSLPALRNDSGEVVWRLTERAMQYLRGLQGLPFRTIDEVQSSRAPGTSQYAGVGFAKNDVRS